MGRHIGQSVTGIRSYLEHFYAFCAREERVSPKSSLFSTRRNANTIIKTALASVLGACVVLGLASTAWSQGYVPTPNGIQPTGGQYSPYQQNWYPHVDDQSRRVSIPMPPSAPTLQDLAVGNMIGGGFGNFGDGTISGTGSSMSTFLDPNTLTNFTSTFSETYSGSFDIPLARATNIADNNSPIPRDRVYASYNNYHNSYFSQQNVTQDAGNINNPDVMANLTDFIENAAFLADNPGFQSTPTNSSRAVNENQDRYTLGIEKAFFSGDLSLELRIPLVDLAQYENAGNPLIPGNSFAGGTDDPLGNIALNIKHVLWDSIGPEHSAVFTWGAGLVFPTGEGATINLYNTSFHVDDSSVHFTPFLAFLVTRNDHFFIQSFLSLDVANTPVNVIASGLGNVGSYHIPNLAHIDVGMGYWLFHNRDRQYLRGIAPMVEYHYTSQMQDPQGTSFNLAAGTNPTSTGMVTLNANTNRYNIQNITTGLHVDLASWANMRAAGVFPLENGLNREFDASFALQLDLTR